MKKLTDFVEEDLCFSFFSCVGGCGYQTPVSFFCRYGDEKIESYYIRDYQNGDDCIYLSETEDYSQLYFTWKLKKSSPELVSGPVNKKINIADFETCSGLTDITKLVQNFLGTDSELNSE